MRIVTEKTHQNFDVRTIGCINMRHEVPGERNKEDRGSIRFYPGRGGASQCTPQNDGFQKFRKIIFKGVKKIRRSPNNIRGEGNHTCRVYIEEGQGGKLGRKGKEILLLRHGRMN